VGILLLLPTIISTGWTQDNKLLSSFMKTPYYKQLTEAYENLNVDALYRSYLHGPRHIERVLLLGALIAWKESLDRHGTEMLLYACSYHDIGRINDYRDDEHGSRSAELLKTERFTWLRDSLNKQDQRILLAMIAAHSHSDQDMFGIGQRYQVADENMTRYMKLASCLKDADNLDRVRLHDLDTSRLRHPSSVDLVPFAEALFHKY